MQDSGRLLVGYGRFHVFEVVNSCKAQVVDLVALLFSLFLVAIQTKIEESFKENLELRRRRPRPRPRRQRQRRRRR